MAKSDLDRRYERILAWEDSVARAIARAVREPQPLSVWEVTIPVVFILNHFRTKALRERFSRNLLFTKKLALDGARDMEKEGISPEAVKERVARQTADIISADSEGLYAEEIRREQFGEVDILLPHYGLLLRASGRDYPSLVREAYRSREDYLAFLEELRIAEDRVYGAALKNLGDRGEPEVVARMQKAAEECRLSGVGKIFGLAAERRS